MEGFVVEFGGVGVGDGFGEVWCGVELDVDNTKPTAEAGSCGSLRSCDAVFEVGDESADIGVSFVGGSVEEHFTVVSCCGEELAGGCGG